MTDLPLLAEGEEQARTLQASLAGWSFVDVRVSPRARARRTAELAGLAPTAVDDDLVEVDYGSYGVLGHEHSRPVLSAWALR